MHTLHILVFAFKKCLVCVLFKVATEAPQEAQTKEEEEELRTRTTNKIKTMLILLTVGKKLIRNPNTHATFLGLIWASIHFK